MQFELLKTDKESSARAGIIHTDHGDIHTPIFMPVGTQASVKAVHQSELESIIKAQIILGNTYHLFLRPGNEILNRVGGLHSFMNWKKPILTDSGGYQVFSLSARRKVKAEGVYFSSHIDGSKHLFTPESVVDTQRILGSDIMMALDECPAYPCTKPAARKSLEITKAWLERGIAHFKNTEPLYGHDQIFVPIAQGSIYDDLRIESLQFNGQFKTPVQAIGGLSVGEPAEDLYRLVHLSTQHMSVDNARYLMGVGTPANILECISAGIDMFDCVLPSRNARHGILFTTQGIMNIRNKKWKDDFKPIDEGIQCPTSNNHSKAYLRHLFVSGEILGMQIATLQNLSFYLHLVSQAREMIFIDKFQEWKNAILQVINQRL
ncbi:MAG: tRNA guanosine(34) transglycosylase Tgt [Saprospiraceae bacterium]|nr:tRNA guanosine(34) transglycosylase Tgt [Saprospiraceae bacterium]